MNKKEENGSFSSLSFMMLIYLFMVSAIISHSSCELWRCGIQPWSQLILLLSSALILRKLKTRLVNSI